MVASSGLSRCIARFCSLCLSGLLAVLLLILSGCATAERRPVTLEERLPPPPAPTSYRQDPDWWRAYNDPTLNSLVETALRNNVDYAKAAISVNRTLYQAKLIGTDLLPTFSGDLSASASRHIRTGDSSTRSVGYDLSVSYELDLWRKLADSADAAEWEYQATVEDRESARLALINNVINAYFNLCYLDEAITVTEETVANYERLLRIAEARFSTGKSDSVEPAQSKQSLLQARNNLLDFQTRKKTAEQTLRDLLNATPGMECGIAYASLLEARMPPADLDVPVGVLANRPDLRAAEHRLHSAFKDLSATEKSWYPSVTLGSSLRSSDNHIRTAFDFPVAGGSITVSLPFLDWNRVYWNVKISEADFDTVKLDFEKALTTALNEVDAYAFAADRAALMVRNVDEKYVHDRDISLYYRQRWDAGAGELLDLLNAMNTEASSRLSLLTSRYDQIKYENLLYQALAGRYTKAFRKP